MLLGQSNTASNILVCKREKHHTKLKMSKYRHQNEKDSIKLKANDNLRIFNFNT